MLNGQWKKTDNPNEFLLDLNQQGNVLDDGKNWVDNWNPPLALDQNNRSLFGSEKIDLDSMRAIDDFSQLSAHEGLIDPILPKQPNPDSNREKESVLMAQLTEEDALHWLSTHLAPKCINLVQDFFAHSLNKQVSQLLQDLKQSFQLTDQLNQVQSNVKADLLFQSELNWLLEHKDDSFTRWNTKDQLDQQVKIRHLQWTNQHLKDHVLSKYQVLVDSNLEACKLMVQKIKDSRRLYGCKQMSQLATDECIEWLQRMPHCSPSKEIQGTLFFIEHYDRLAQSILVSAQQRTKEWSEALTQLGASLKEKTELLACFTDGRASSTNEATGKAHESLRQCAKGVRETRHQLSEWVSRASDFIDRLSKAWHTPVALENWKQSMEVLFDQCHQAWTGDSKEVNNCLQSQTNSDLKQVILLLADAMKRVEFMASASPVIAATAEQQSADEAKKDGSKKQVLSAVAGWRQLKRELTQIAQLNQQCIVIEQQLTQGLRRERLIAFETLCEHLIRLQNNALALFVQKGRELTEKHRELMTQSAASRRNCVLAWAERKELHNQKSQSLWHQIQQTHDRHSGLVRQNCSEVERMKLQVYQTSEVYSKCLQYVTIFNWLFKWVTTASNGIFVSSEQIRV